MDVLVFTVSDEEHGERIDKVATARFEAASRSQIKRWLLDGRVEVDGVSVLPKAKVRAGSEICITPAPPEVPNLVPQDIPLEICFEDEHLVVLNKPAGLVVHPAPGHPDGTLVNAMLFHFGKLPGGDGIRPGIVHRLDKDTSGVMCVAKSAQAHEGLVRLFSTHDIDRTYLAWVWGRVTGPYHFDTLHGRHPRDRKKFSSKVTSGRTAITDIEPIETIGSSTLVRCTLQTGRTHQIRMHLSEHGCAIIGDPMYGRPPKEPAMREIDREMKRQALHATVLGFVHPVTNERVHIERPPPEDMQALRDALQYLVDNPE